MRLIVGSTLLLALLATLGCASSFADPSGKHRSLKVAQQRYTELVRWGEIDRASIFVDPDLLEEYLDQATKMKDIRVTDFDSNAPQYRDENNAATVIVVYRAYSLATLVEKEIREKQEWYREEGMKNHWRVRPELDRIVAVTTGSP